MSSEPGSAKVKVAKIEEGETLKKSHINDTNDSWEYASNRLTGINVREEGLDRRSFSSETWHEEVGDKGASRLSSQKDFKIGNSALPGKWGPVNINLGAGHSGNFTNGISDDYCAIEWEWDPNIDTYCILRANFFFEWDVGIIGNWGRDDAGNETEEAARDDLFMKFGIRAGRVGAGFDFEKEDGIGFRQPDRPGGSVFSQAQIGLNSDWSKHTSKRGPINYNYDRRTAISSSVTIIAGGSSGENLHTWKLPDNNCAIDMREAGTYRAVLVGCHRRFEDTIEFGIWSDVGEDGGEPITLTSGPGRNYPEIGYGRLMVQKFRR